MGRLGELMQCLYTAFEEIGRQAKEKEKKDCVYFLFALQRCDLIERRAVGSLVQDEIMVCNQLITHILRFAFRDLEQQEVFKEIGKLPFWVIRWGEYKDYSEIVMQVKREEKGQEAWLERLEQYKENPEALTADYWYRETLALGDCRKKNMYFIVFEECTLKGIDFSRADLTGARFLRCRIEKCRFSGANLSQADFEECSFEEDDFGGASLAQTTFSEEGFQPELFDGIFLWSRITP
ncbi:pentapeptide repeat-containing protein [Lachnospiraceae bacterium 64-25]